MGISFVYNFRCDPDLGIGKAACRRIPCTCLTCLGMLEETWVVHLDDKDQPRYRVNKRCIYWKNFKSYNNWMVVNLVTTNISSTEEEKCMK